MRNFTLIGFLLCLSHIVLSQGIFSAQIDQSKVYEGSNFAVEFSLSNSKGRGFTPPDFSPFVVVQGPQRSSQTTIINGKMESRESYRYILNATKKGSYVIPAAKITSGKKELTTRPLKIQVLPGLTKNDLGKNNIGQGKFFILAKANKDTFYNGEQIVLEYLLYSKIRGVSAQLTQEPVCASCHDMTINSGMKRGPRKVEIDGEAYYETEIYRRAFYPMRTEDIHIKPVAAVINIPVEGGRYFFQQYRRQSGVANGLDLTVLPLPNKLPKTFMGLTGNYTFDIKATRAENDAVTVNVYLLGDGDPNRFVIPTFPVQEGIESYEPKVIDDNTDLGNGERAYHRKTIEYTFVPTRGGKHIIEPKISYWEPDSAALVTWKGDSIVFQSNQAVSKKSDSQDDLSLARIESEGSYFDVQKLTSMLKYLYWAIAGFILFLYFFRRNQEKQKANIPPPTAYEIFQTEMQSTQSLDAKEQLHHTDQTLSAFLQKKLNISQSDWSVQRGAEQISNPTLKEEFKAIYQAFYLASYAGSSPSNREEVIQKARQLAEQIEKM